MTTAPASILPPVATGAGAPASQNASGVTVLPDDQHNRALVRAVHPVDWQNPQPAGRYNLVVVGGGPAGLVAAVGAAGLGAKVALIEKHLLGGDCLNFGCVPSKALLRASRAAHDVRDAGRFGVEVSGEVRIDFPKVMARMRERRAGLASPDSAARLCDLGVDVYLGAGTFTGPETVEVGGQTLRFKRAVVATGARAAVPPVPGLDTVDALTNETVFSLTELPRRLAAIGAGPIGCELAQAFARFGAEVTLLELAPQILIREDPDAAKRIEKALEADGVRTLCAIQIQKVAPGPGGTSVLTIVQDGRTTTLEVDRILVGAGRRPNVEGLGLEAAGVGFDRRKGVEVDDRLRTSNPRIYAAGDVCSRFQFTHAADAMARIVIGNALFMRRGRASALTIPWCTYTDPEIAHVGLYEKDALVQGIEVETFVQELSEVDRAVLDGDKGGFVKVHVKKGTDRILGATVVARHAGEMIGEMAVAMKAGLGLKGLSGTIHPYPTQAEAFKRVGDAYNRTRLTPLVAGLLRRWLAWTR